jgi:hypothetical protein
MKEDGVCMTGCIDVTSKCITFCCFFRNSSAKATKLEPYIATIGTPVDLHSRVTTGWYESANSNMYLNHRINQTINVHILATSYSVHKLFMEYTANVY